MMVILGLPLYLENTVVVQFYQSTTQRPTWSLFIFKLMVLWQELGLNWNTSLVVRCIQFYICFWTKSIAVWKKPAKNLGIFLTNWLGVSHSKQTCSIEFNCKLLVYVSKLSQGWATGSCSLSLIKQTFALYNTYNQVHFIIDLNTTFYIFSDCTTNVTLIGNGTFGNWDQRTSGDSWIILDHKDAQSKNKVYGFLRKGDWKHKVDINFSSIHLHHQENITSYTTNF